ncbi:MAG: CPXCG motif-containing cysteine-rich protein [Candidatus Sulfotelmatobacter sp.]
MRNQSAQAAPSKDQMPALAAGVCSHSPMESGFQCAACGEWNITSVDESAGRRQNYVEDCQVCCKPNVLRVEYDASSQEFFICAELE